MNIKKPNRIWLSEACEKFEAQRRNESKKELQNLQAQAHPFNAHNPFRECNINRAPHSLRNNGMQSGAASSL